MLELLPLANAGTPLIWASLCTLLVGNIGLGIFEAWLLAKLVKVEIAPGWLIAANYISMFAGSFLVKWSNHYSNVAHQEPFTYAMPVLWGVWATAFVLTLLLEWPFYSVAAGGFGFRRTGLKYSLYANTISYAGLTLIAMLLGQTSAVSQVQRTSLTDLQAPPGWVFYMHPTGTQARRIRTDGTRDETVADVKVEGGQPNAGWTRLTIESRPGQPSGSLYLRGLGKDRLIKPAVAKAGTFAVTKRLRPDGSLQLGNLTFGATLSWKFPSRVYNGFWAAEGLTVNGKRYAFETPMLAIPWRSVTELPDGTIVANFGDQILLFDPKREKAAVLVKGFGAAVALDKPPGR